MATLRKCYSAAARELRAQEHEGNGKLCMSCTLDIHSRLSSKALEVQPLAFPCKSLARLVVALLCLALKYQQSKKRKEGDDRPAEINTLMALSTLWTLSPISWQMSHGLARIQQLPGQWECSKKACIDLRDAAHHEAFIPMRYNLWRFSLKPLLDCATQEHPEDWDVLTEHVDDHMLAFHSSPPKCCAYPMVVNKLPNLSASIANKFSCGVSTLLWVIIKHPRKGRVGGHPPKNSLV